VTTNLQNAYMYLSSVLWNVLFLAWQGRMGEALAAENLAAVFSPVVLTIIAIMSSVGLVTGFFLKHLDSVLKSIASALEVVFTTVASTALFGMPMRFNDILAAVLVGAGVALYARPAPVSDQAYTLLAESQPPSLAKGSV
jgi:UDP-sugar transporter A1/2/3